MFNNEMLLMNSSPSSDLPPNLYEITPVDLSINNNVPSNTVFGAFWFFDWISGSIRPEKVSGAQIMVVAFSKSDSDIEGIKGGTTTLGIGNVPDLKGRTFEFAKRKSPTDPSIATQIYTLQDYIMVLSEQDILDLENAVINNEKRYFYLEFV